MSVKWQGVMPALTTKFTADNRLDLPMFETNVRAQLDAGVEGLILGGTLGEASTLLPEEKDQLVAAALRLAGDVPVIVNIAEQSTQGAVAAAQRAKVAGARGLMVLPPMRYKATSRETVVYFKAVAAATDLPILIYNNPVDYGIEVTPDMFGELLRDCPTVQAVKESTRDISNITRLRNRFGDRLKILTGVDTLGMESILMGADGWVAGLVCAFPAETVAVYALARAGRIAEALPIYRWFLPLLELDISPQLVQNIKLAEVATGIGTEHVRPPRLPLAGAERQRVLDIIQKGIESRPELPDYKGLL
ncbi:dihydrodipicolinate synthase family protein [Robiginitalea sediminis]|uniref:dihydrodipicolinate synthase family protein n=1 Tax=Robiginitalea sediminis TaxID=1982593 RepID=UPI000B4AEE3C|nr:dihydrodipicolinate synthase family protein [Robiginitalea sediminis]